MTYGYDFYDKLYNPWIVLGTPNKEEIGFVRIEKSVSVVLNFNDISEANFKVPKYINGSENKYYDLVESLKLVQIQYLGWFQLDVVEIGDGLYTYKQCKCYSLENELISKKVFAINGVFDLYNIEQQDISLLHIISKYCNWSIGHVDNELIGKARTFDIDSQQIYSLLTQNIAKSFGCVFQFDTYERKINVYKFENIGNNTNLIFTYNNVIKQLELETPLDKIKTCFYVRGGDDLDIRAVNPTGTNEIYNFDYYMNTNSEKHWMTDGLLVALQTYIDAYNANKTGATTLLQQQKTLQEQINVLRTKLPDPSQGESLTDWTKYGLDGLNEKKKYYEELQSAYLSAGYANPSNANYSTYNSNYAIIVAINSEIVVRQGEISSKESDIENIVSQLNLISSTLTLKDYFTVDQWNELQSLIHSDDYIDETFVAAETDTDDQVLAIKEELLDVSTTALSKVAQPQYTMTLSCANIFALSDGESFSNKINLGDFIVIKFSDDYYSYARVLSIEMDFDNLDSLKITFSSVSSLDADSLDWQTTLAQARSTNTSLSLSKAGYDKASMQTSEVQDFMTNALIAGVNNIKNTDQNWTYEINEYGLRFKEWLEDQNKYSPYEMWINGKNLFFSDDNFESARLGIGLFQDIEGNDYYGVLAEVLVGQMVMSSSLYVTNTAGNFTINKDGFTATNGVNTIGIVPNDSDGLFYISKTIDEITTKVLWFDSDGNGNFSGTVTASTFIGGDIYSDNWFSKDINGDYIYDEFGNKVESGIGTYINLTDGESSFKGMTTYYWLGETYTDRYLETNISNGMLKVVDNTEGLTSARQLFFTPEGISTNATAVNSPATIDFYSRVYETDTDADYNGLTFITYKSPVALRSRVNGIIINPESDSALGNLFSFHIKSASETITDGVLSYGLRGWNEGETSRVYNCGIRFSGNTESPKILAVGADSALDNLVDFYCKNLYADNLPKKITTATLNSAQTQLIAILEDDSTTTWNISTDGSGNTIITRA